MIPFKIVPVFGYEDVMNANDNFLQGQQLSSQVLNYSYIAFNHAILFFLIFITLPIYSLFMHFYILYFNFI